jgi:hypothetical protein
MYAAELNVPLTMILIDVTGSIASNCAENRVEFVPISVVSGGDRVVIGTKSIPDTTTQPAHQPTTNQTQQPENPFNPCINVHLFNEGRQDREIY